MKRFFLILIATSMALATLMVHADDNTWKTKYGLDGCDNPVFTRPDHEVPGGRVEGAGICMNDGEAYQNHDIGLSREWHYAPKLNFAQREAASIHRVLGMGRPFNGERNLATDGRTLKFNAKRVNGCGAFVAYRVGASGPDDLAQYLATYDDKGFLVDVMMMGGEHTINDLFKMEPHGDYKLVGNWSRLEAVIDRDNPNKFSINLENRYEQSDKQYTWKMKRYYHIDNKGYFVIDSITNENAPQFNPNALNALDMELMPLAGEGNYDKAMTMLHTLQPTLRKSEEGTRLLSTMMDRLYAYEPEAFLVWVWKCPKCNLTNEVRDKLANSNYVGQPFAAPLLTEDVHRLTNVKARKYWTKMLRLWSQSE